MPLTHQASYHSRPLPGQNQVNTADGHREAVSGCIAWICNIASLPDSFSPLLQAKTFAWGMGDGAFTLAVSLMQHWEKLYKDNGVFPADMPDNAALASLNHFLLQQGYRLPTLSLMGPVMMFCVIYPTLCRALGHADIALDNARAREALATFLAGAGDLSSFLDPSRGENYTPTWQSDVGDISSLPITTRLPLTTRLPVTTGPSSRRVTVLPTAVLGLPGTSAPYAVSPDGIYRLSSRSSALFIGELHSSVMNVCPRPVMTNITSPDSSLAGLQLIMHLDVPHDRALYALSTGNHSLEIDTAPDAAGSLSIPVFEFGDPLRFPAVASTDISPYIPPWQRPVTEIAIKPRQRRGVIHDGMLALVPAKNKPPELPDSTILAVRVIPSELAQEERLYRLNVFSEDGLLHPLFAPPNTTIDCLSCMPCPVEPVRASSLFEMIEKVYFWTENLGVGIKQQAIEQFVANQDSLDPSDDAAANTPLASIVAACGLLMSENITSNTLHISPSEAQQFFSTLLTGSSFDHNEELKIALIASPIGEAALAKVLLGQLDANLPAALKVVENSHRQLQTLLLQTSPLTYGHLDALLTLHENNFTSQLVTSLKEPIGMLSNGLSRENVAKISQWYRRIIEYNYPFMLLRGSAHLHQLECLSSEGLLINLGVRRVQEQKKIALLDRRELAALGEDLLLNNPPEALSREFNHLEMLLSSAGKHASRGIIDTANLLKRKSILVIHYIEAKRRLAGVLSDNTASDTPTVEAFNRYQVAKRRLYALALMGIPEDESAHIVTNLHRIQGVSLQFVKMTDLRASSAEALPFVGFILSCNEDSFSQEDKPQKRHYFITLIPAQRDTLQPLVFRLDVALPHELSARENYLNNAGKNSFVALLFGEFADTHPRYRFYLNDEGSLHTQFEVNDWTKTVDILANTIVERQYRAVSVPGPTPALPPDPSSGPVYTWFRYLLNQMIYLTPLGNCKDAAVDIINAHIAPFILDGAFCLYSLSPLGEEEQGAKSVANVIKNVLRSTLEDDLENEERKPILSKLEETIQQVESQLHDENSAAEQVKYHLTGNPQIQLLLQSSDYYHALKIGKIPQFYLPLIAWRDPLHDVLYFSFRTSTGERVYRFDELNMLLLPNPSPSLLSLMQREPHIADSRLLTVTLNSGNSQQLRMEIYQHERMRNMANYGLKNSAGIAQGYDVIADETPSGTLYYPGIKQAASDSQYQLAPAGLPEDQQLVVRINNGRLNYWRDNVISSKPASRAVPFVDNSDAYQNMLDSVENIPAGWQIKTIWIEEQAGARIVVGWEDTQGKLQLRHPDSQGKWLVWDSHTRGIYCQHFSRSRRNDSPNNALITGLFSPGHCGYLTVPKANLPDQAATLELLSAQLLSLREPVILNKIDCAQLARQIVDDFDSLWEDIPQNIRKYITNIRDWKTDIRSFNEFSRFTNLLSDYSYHYNNAQILTYEEKSVRGDFCRRVLNLISEYEKLKMHVLESKRLRDSFRATKTFYYNMYISRSMKANNWINRWFNRISTSDRIKGDYVVKASTPDKIRSDYTFLYAGITGAIATLNEMAAKISLRLRDPASNNFLRDALGDFFKDKFTVLQVNDFKDKLKKYLTQISRFTISEIVVVGDRYSGGRLGAECFKTPIEKLVYSDGAYSFVYNSVNDKRIYLLDYLSNQQFIEYSLAHELGHLAFDEVEYVFQEEIYLKSDSIIRNFNISGASKFAKFLMSDKEFFLDYIARHANFGAAFYRHFFAHARDKNHKSALRNYYSLFLDRNSIHSIYSSDPVMRKKELKPLVDYLFSLPNTKLNIAYYNPDIFSGLFTYLHEKATVMPAVEAEQGKRSRREATPTPQQQQQAFFILLLLSPLYQKHLQDSSVHY